jgi:hypothetical protein
MQTRAQIQLEVLDWLDQNPDRDAKWLRMTLQEEFGMCCANLNKKGDEHKVDLIYEGDFNLIYKKD